MTESAGRPAIDRFLQGVAEGHSARIRDAWRELIDSPQTSVEAVCAKLATGRWDESPVGPTTQYLAGLLSLIAILDRSVFREEVDRLLKANIHPTVRTVLRSFDKTNPPEPVTFVGSSVPVFIAGDIGEQEFVASRIRKWARIVGEDMNCISRIRVITEQPEFDYRGSYSPRFSQLTLVWPAKMDDSWYRHVRILLLEQTFYHEVGHHAFGHLEAGQVEAQENEAERYSARMIKKAHLSVRVLNWTIGPIIRGMRKVGIRLTDR